MMMYVDVDTKVCQRHGSAPRSAVKMPSPGLQKDPRVQVVLAIPAETTHFIHMSSTFEKCSDVFSTPLLIDDEL